MNNLLPELPPAIDLETKQILKKTITANRKLAELKGIINTIPNATILINTLYIQEAKDSSAISKSSHHKLLNNRNDSGQPQRIAPTSEYFRPY